VTVRLGILQKVQTWVMALAGKPPEPKAIEPVEKPLHKLSRMMMAMASPDGRRGGAIQIMVDAVNQDHITCKSRELLKEGEKLELAMLLTGVGHVKIPVTVQWVLLSSFGHSAGLHIEHNHETPQMMSSFVHLLQNNRRG